MLIATEPFQIQWDRLAVDRAVAPREDLPGEGIFHNWKVAGEMLDALDQQGTQVIVSAFVESLILRRWNAQGEQRQMAAGKGARKARAESLFTIL